MISSGRDKFFVLQPVFALGQPDPYLFDIRFRGQAAPGHALSQQGPGGFVLNLLYF